MAADNNTFNNVEKIEVILRDEIEFPQWMPIEGEETLQLLDHLKFSQSDRAMVKREAVNVLAQSVPPSLPSGRETGLVIGYIQSGKTTSFTTVSALAKDNGYRLIIVITGVTKNLFNQSNNRLEKDLRLKQRIDRKWQFLPNPKPREDIKQRIAKALRKEDTLLNTGRQTVLITVMKNRTHLKNLIELLSNMSFTGIPTLIIDDEADQASLNNLVNNGKESATYRRIIQIRNLFPHHTFLQYTATPQAPLLINVIDALSPNFSILLTPGPAYTGGKTFFERDMRLIRRILEKEVPSKDQLLTEPPESLLEAMRLFFLGVASGLISGEIGKNRSMMVHPSKETMQHANYDHWVRSIQKHWEKTLNLPDQAIDRRELIEDFEKAYIDLDNTVEDLPSFDELLRYLPHAIGNTIVTTVNASSGQTPQPDWDQDYAHIVVGGEVLNRGYTIEGLTVTYMPRSKGVGNADTIQQRARWFGYKADYLDYCRVYLTDEQCSIYRDYVNHEENVRFQLRENALAGKSLHDWKRAFLLSADLRPTRHNVMDLEYVRGNYSANWFEQHVPHDSPQAVEANRKIIREFLSKLSFQPDEGHQNRTDMQRHLVASDVSLNFAYQELLTKFLVTNSDESRQFIGLLLQLRLYLDEHPNENIRCTVYEMSRGQSRERSVNDDDEIPTLFQGPNPDKSGKYYPGDKKIRNLHMVTIQVHMLKILKNKSVVLTDVPTIAVALPEEMSSDWIVQTEKKASKQFARLRWE